MGLGLVMVDIQKDYFPGGKYPLVQPEAAAGQGARMLAFFRQHQLPIFHVRHLSIGAEATFFVPDTPGADFFPVCAPQAEEAVIIKHHPDSFLETTLKQQLTDQDIDALVVCGMMTHMCIDTTVRSAASQGFAVHLIADACATRDLVWEGTTIPALAVQQVYLASLAGTFAQVSSVAAWLQAHV